VGDHLRHCLVVTPMPVVPVRPIVAIQAWVGVAVAVDGSATIPASTITAPPPHPVPSPPPPHPPPLAPPATGLSPPVAGPFCAIASEVPPARSAATIVRVFRVVIIMLHNAYAYTHPKVPRKTHREAGCLIQIKV